jgi:hypothetical protein
MAPSFTKILAVVGISAFLAVAPVNANGCYSGGESYASVGTDAEIISAATTACNYFAATYVAGEKLTYCSNIGDNSVNWAVTNQAGSTQTLNAANCLAAMTIEINACSSGSLQTHGTFLYQDDPNAGAC